MDELTGAVNEVLRDFRQKWREFQEQEPLWDVLKGFAHAIDWKEPWIIAILVTHVVLLLMAVSTRKQATIQLLIFGLASGIIYFLETLNRVGNQHWRKFSGQNYFDASGIFMCSVVALPLLLVLFIVLINYLISCTQLLIKAKRRELIHKAKQRQQQGNMSGGDKKSQ